MPRQGTLLGPVPSRRHPAGAHCTAHGHWRLLTHPQRLCAWILQKRLFPNREHVPIPEKLEVAELFTKQTLINSN